MSDLTKEQRAMAADACERVAKLLRGGEPDPYTMRMALKMASDLLVVGAAIENYDCALRCCDVEPNARVGAVTAILAGRHPDDSLPGRLVAHKGNAERERDAASDRWSEWRCEGEAHALGHALILIGCKVPT